MRRIHGPAEAVVEGIAHTLERLPHEKYLGLLLTPGKSSAFSAGVTSDIALTFGRSLLKRFDVDWSAAGKVGDDLDQLVEFMLRVFQSLVIDPGRPPRTGNTLRAFLRRWVAPAVAGPTFTPPVAMSRTVPSAPKRTSVRRSAASGQTKVAR